MNDIESIKGFQPKSEGGGLFLKLSDGEEVKVRITSLPVIFENEFKLGEEISLSTRFGFVVWNHDLNKAQIWVTNSATYGQQVSPLLEDEEYGDWREYDVKIKRTGEKAQTRYHLRPGVKHYALDKVQQDTCDAIDLLGNIKKSDSASKVMWLSEYRELEEGPKIKNKVSEKEEETINLDTPDDEPINLDEIPF